MIEKFIGCTTIESWSRSSIDKKGGTLQAVSPIGLRELRLER